MTKADFVKRVAERADLSVTDATEAVQAFLDEVTEALADGEEVQFAGFGKFSTSQRAARTGVNPQDPSKKIDIPARRVPKFSAGAGLKNAVS
ncbi:MAG: HU family DNA-binding protein [Thermoleophilia bacterium]|nr:HU family DNA-binding protein [Thermoleophilia bacterium]MDH3724953.1 HU family DNA-binding protein [Thermoleophilia bacterium]